MDEIYLLSDNSLVLEKFIPLLINKDINNDNDDDRDDIDSNVWVRLRFSVYKMKCVSLLANFPDTDKLLSDRRINRTHLCR